MKFKISLFLLLFISSMSIAQTVVKTMKRLPDTGQTMSYTSTAGEDNDYSINTPSFIDHGNGTITDTITGLMWMKMDGGEMTIENARVYADTCTASGYSDWRLPLPIESYSILNHQANNPAIFSTYFTSTTAEYWWTSVVQCNDSNKIWATNAGGGIGNHPKIETISAGGTKHFHARLVRDVQTPIILTDRYTNQQDGTFRDELTNLVWQQTALTDSITWEDALHYADTCSLGAHSDWRLPNVKEIQSLNEESHFGPSINTNYILNVGVGKVWSSTTLPNQTGKAWYLDTQYGITTYQNKINKLKVLLVRGPEPPAITSAVHPEFEKPADHAFPNPFHNTIHLVGDKEQNAVLFTILGECVYAGKDIAAQDFSKLPAGVYILKTPIYTEKLIKQ